MRACRPGSWRRGVVLGALACTLAVPGAHRAAIAAPAAGESIDWAAVGEEAASLLSQYLRIDTTNPPGNETAAARFLAAQLRAEGIEAEIAGAEPGRGNVYARLSGTGASDALILLHHLDVVPAAAADWTTSPLGGERRDGFIHGRGALDCKGVGIAHLMAVLLLRRQGVRLPRDIILLGTADEETGGSLGAGWVVANRRQWLDGATMLLTEGGFIAVDDTDRGIPHVAVAEKSPCWLRLVASGDGGHGSAPPPATAVTRLLDALERLRKRDVPIRVTPPVARYFAALAPSKPEPHRSAFRDLASALRDPSYRALFEEDPRWAALVRNTLTPTVLVAGSKTNVIPVEAQADLDCRLVPGDDPVRFIEGVREVVADPMVRVEPLLRFPATASDPETPLMEAIRRVAAVDTGHGGIVPSVTAGFTDSRYFRSAGITSYGFVPFTLPTAELHAIHGVNERLKVEVLRDAIRFLYRLLQEIEAPAGSRRAPATR